MMLSGTISEILPHTQVYMTGCDLEKSFIFEKTVEVTSHKPFPIHV